MTSKSPVLAAAPCVVGLALLTAARAPAAQDAADPSEPAINGAAIFVQHCKTCHTTQPGQPSYAGPNLAGIVDRKAGSAQYRYSPALRNSGLTWTSENLDAFLAAPKTKVPGTSMFISLTDTAKRQAVVTYLGTLSSEPVPQP
ncbi:MAG: c-type cytochrome [Novosphingobium sp.]|nr:c-type cytochrome [Novosphingobium sp.]